MYARDYSQDTGRVRSFSGRTATTKTESQRLQQQEILREKRARSRSQQSRLRRQHRQHESVWGQARDAGIAIGVNVAIAAAVLTGAARLLPRLHMQQQNLAGVNASLATVKSRVDVLQERVELGLDPLQTEAAITEHLNVLPPQRIVVDLGPEDGAEDLDAKRAVPTQGE